MWKTCEVVRGALVEGRVQLDNWSMWRSLRTNTAANIDQPQLAGSQRSLSSFSSNTTSMDAAEFHAEVYRIIALIPVGRVTSYGKNHVVNFT